MRRRGESLSARLRTEVQSSGQIWEKNDVPLSANAGTIATEPRGSVTDGFPCPRHIKPLVFFYKYLQPIGDRRLRLQLPMTLVCERNANTSQEHILWLRTDQHGNVIKVDKTTLWRKTLYQELLEGCGREQEPSPTKGTIRELQIEADDHVIAVRNVTQWKEGAQNRNKSVVLTKRTFDTIVNAPADRAFSIQRYVRCRGARASIYRVIWSDKPNKCYAVNMFNEHKIATDEQDDELERNHSPPPEGSAYEIAIHKVSKLSTLYCVTSTSDPKTWTRLPKILGNPVAEGVQAAGRIVDHVHAQLPGIRLQAMIADFVKDSDGVWWFIRVLNFDAYYRIEIPREIQLLPESAVQIPEVMRSAYFRQWNGIVTLGVADNTTIPECFLCGSLCKLSQTFHEEFITICKRQQEFDGHDVLKIISEYRMTLKMALGTIYLLRQRDVFLPSWENAVQGLLKSRGQGTYEFTVCMICYQIYKQQQKLHQIALELHAVLNGLNWLDATDRGNDKPMGAAIIEPNISSDLFDLTFSNTTMKSLCNEQSPQATLDRIRVFQSEASPLLARRPIEERHTMHEFSYWSGMDVDPTSTQMRLVFFFHEIQDGGPELTPTDFYLVYQLGQVFNRIYLEGSKCHTPNRWQLCEARVHYMCGTVDSFIEYCMDKRLQIKMKTVDGDSLFGHTVLPLRNLITAAKSYGNSLRSECRVDFLLEIHTHSFQLLTLKLTMGLLVDPVPLRQIREGIRDQIYLREEPLDVYWPVPSFCFSGLAVPSDWVGALTPSEYISVLPMRSRAVGYKYHRDGPALASNFRRGSLDNKKALRLPHSSPRRFTFIDHQHLLDSIKGEMESSSLSQWSRQSKSQESGEANLDTGKVLSSTLSVVKRLIFRVAGDVTQISATLLGVILRYASFLANTEMAVCSKWNQPATFQLTRKYSIDHIFGDRKLVSIPALVMLGELLLILLKNRILPPQLDIESLESCITGFWLHEDANGWDTLPHNSPHTPTQRTMWNRAVRRCSAAQLDPAFCSSFNWSGFLPTNGDCDGQSATEASSQMGFRRKIQTLMLCELFELIETLDNGYADIAELRSFYKCYRAQDEIVGQFSMPSILDPLCIRENLSPEETSCLSAVLELQQHLSCSATLHSFVESETVTKALSRFDRVGCAELEFEEFYSIAETALNAKQVFFTESVGDEPTRFGFCLRHGKTELYAIDGVCVACTRQYRDREIPTVTTNSIHDHAYSLIDNAQELVEVATEGNDCNLGCQPDSFSDRADVPRTRVRKMAVWPKHDEATTERSSTAGTEMVFEDGALANILGKLEAAEWHILHREHSLDRASLEQLFSERKLSSGRRASISSNALKSETKSSIVTELTELVHEAEQRKQNAANRSKKVNARTKNLTKNNKKRGHPSTTPLFSSRSLSSLLHTELLKTNNIANPSTLRKNSSCTKELINKVARGEEKRKKLDQLVLAKIEEVKRRMAKLMSEET